MAGTSYLIRYWICFGDPDNAKVTFLDEKCCGVTAFDEEDAMLLLRSEVFKNKPLPPIIDLVPNVDVSTLDSGHVLPNIGDVTRRGVWFPSLNR